MNFGSVTTSAPTSGLMRSISSTSYEMAIGRYEEFLMDKMSFKCSADPKPEAVGNWNLTDISTRILCSLLCPKDQWKNKAAQGTDQHEIYEKMLLDTLEKLKAKKQSRKMEQLQKELEKCLQLKPRAPLHKASIEDFDALSKTFAHDARLQMASILDTSLTRYIEAVDQFCSSIKEAQRKGGFRTLVNKIDSFVRR